MKALQTLSAVLILTFAASAASGAVVVTAGELATTVSTLSVVPAPSASDQLNGKVAVQIDARKNHADGDFDFVALTDGSVAASYPGQLPKDYPGVNVHCVEMFWDIRSGSSPVSLSDIRVYCANSGMDCRVIPNVDVSVTSAATPTAAGPWAPLITLARPNAAPSNFDYGMMNTTNELGAIRIQNNAGSFMATGVTGLRIDFYASGFDKEFRNPTTTPEAVTTPFIAEVDAFFSIATAAKDWTLY